MLKQCRQTTLALTPPFSLYSVKFFQLPNEHRCLLIDSANSKTISRVTKTTHLMIYSLLILKTSGMSRGIVRALLSDFWAPSPPRRVFPPALPLDFSLPPPPALLILTVITRSDEEEGMHSGGIAMCTNFNPPQPISLYSPNSPDAVLRSAYLLYTVFSPSHARDAKRDKLLVWLVPVLPCLFSPQTVYRDMCGCVLAAMCMRLHWMYVQTGKFYSSLLCVNCNCFCKLSPKDWKISYVQDQRPNMLVRKWGYGGICPCPFALHAPLCGVIPVASLAVWECDDHTQPIYV